MDDRVRRRSGAATRVRAVLVAAAIATLAVGFGSSAAARRAGDGPPAPPDILGVRATDGRLRALFALPVDPAGQPLRADDVTIRVDGQARRARLRGPGTAAVEVAAVVDTAVPADALRRMQAAVIELALDLPVGATLRIIDAAGAASPPSDVPGAAIAAVAELRPGTTDDLRRAVRRGVRLLDRSGRDRTALLVLGRDLDERLRPIGRQPFTRIVHIVSVDPGHDGRPLLDPRSSGTVRAVNAVTDVRPAVDGMSHDLGTAYQAVVDVPAGAADHVETLTIEMRSATGDSATTTVDLDDGVHGDVPDPGTDPAPGIGQAPGATDRGPAGGTGEDAVPSAPGTTGVWSDVLATAAARARGLAGPLAVTAAGIVLAMTIAALGRVLRRAADHAPAVYRARQWVRAMATPPVRHRRASPHAQADEPAPAAAGARRSRRRATHTARPIAKLDDQTHEVLAQAHLSLRRLALASRRAAGSVPDDLFRLAEAQASVALSGPSADLRDVLTGAVAGAWDTGDAQRVRRAARALQIGWQQTAGAATASAVSGEIAAALAAAAPTGSGPDPRRPGTSVRALNPLVQVGLDHVDLAGRPGRDSTLVARAVTAIDIMRAARLASPVLIVSPGLLQDRPRYERALTADLADPRQREAWLRLLCASVSRGAVDSAGRLTRLVRLRGRYREQTGDRRLLSLVDLILAHPVIDLGVLGAHLSLAPDTAARLIPTAVDAGWLAPHGHVDDAWVASEVIAVFAETTAPPARSAARR